MNDHIEAVDAVSRALDRIKRTGTTAEFTLSNGIVLTIKSVPPYLAQAVQNEFKMPQPPKVYMEEKGREEENPNDPAFLREINEIAEKQQLATNDLYLAVGTAIKSVPENMFGPDDDGWILQVEFASKLVGTDLHIEREDQIKRYLHWLRFYALETGGDIALATSLPIQLAGIREGEVEEVIESFRSLPQRGSDSESPTSIEHQNGNTDNRAARRGRPRNR